MHYSNIHTSMRIELKTLLQDYDTIITKRLTQNSLTNIPPVEIGTNILLVEIATWQHGEFGTRDIGIVARLWYYCYVKLARSLWTQNSLTIQPP